jgi:hypothetical protein
MEHRHLPIYSGSLVINVLLSWLILPFVIPPFQGFSPTDLLEVLLWQVSAAIGWPFAILGGLLSQIFTRGYDNLLHLLFMLVYPVMLLLARPSRLLKVPSTLGIAPITHTHRGLFRCNLVLCTQWLHFHAGVTPCTQNEFTTREIQSGYLQGFPAIAALKRRAVLSFEGGIYPE